MDNASNNNMMMRELEHLLCARGVAFHHDGNRVWCFPHVINLVVQAFLAALKANPSAPLSNILEGADPMTIANVKKYVATLECDLVGTGRGVVTACCASGQRRRDLCKLIEDGNDSGYWKGKMINPAHDSMPEVQLLRDCET
ncbi:hypothetical protein PAXRUDRAFT_19136 [Paxillus rubicundulus Ve08.2h10]|uniref:Uncharacterized protein n=1 Tax=Paxillus rubicundulus Ve08.2h10 TaxID=930991 RepID=A0A0D0BV22_9AGAM|nr:hypothetical protein PAXRUDRAFT_19136 [Paxillus rubicundulus Ve08.2h10]